MTVDQLLAKLQKFKARHGGDARVVGEDPLGNTHYVALECGLDDSVKPCPVRLGHFDQSDEKDAQRVFVIS